MNLVALIDAKLGPQRDYLARNGAGFAGSAALHGLLLLLVFFRFHQISQPADETLHTVLIDIIHLGDQTASPQSERKSPVPQLQASARQAPQAHSPQAAVSPHGTRQPDDLANRLSALSKLRAPETDPRLLHGEGTSPAETGSSDAPAGDTAYSLRDFIRAQILRRWNLDLEAPGAQRIVIALHVVMKNNGTITAADIVDKRRFTTDAAWRRIAMSARNAVLLASPIALPPGNYPAETEMTLKLDPRDALR